MSEQEAFEKWFEKEFGDAYYPTDGMKLAWQAATTEANKRIADLELQLQNWKDFSKKVQKIDFNDYLELQASNNRLQAKLTAEKVYVNELLKSSNHLFVENEQLKAHINILREAIIKIEFEYDYTLDSDMTNAVSEGVKLAMATPAESLQAFENEVIEKCAKVAQDSELGYLAMKICGLKEVK